MMMYMIFTIWIALLSRAVLAYQDVVPRKAFGCDAPVVLNASTNVWKDYKLHANSIYRNTVINVAKNITDPSLQAKALRIAETGTFAWIETRNEISKIDELVKDVPCKNIVGLVVSGVPQKSCDTSDNLLNQDPWDYVEEFVIPIATKIRSHPNTPFAIIIEPSVLPNYALAPAGSCENVRNSWYRNVPKALKVLDLPNVIMYLDGGHGGIFGWTGRSWQGTKPQPKWFHQDEGLTIQGAKELTDTWKAAGTLTQFRGLAVNVRNYNSWDLRPGEMFGGENTCYDLYNKARNEKQYLEYLRVAGFKKMNSSMPYHNIMDTSRSGINGIRQNWDDWCNLNGAGNGPKPSADTNDQNLDAFVWATGPGISDGTSDESNAGFKEECARDTAFKPMPDRGSFSADYFEMMLKGCRWCVRRRELKTLEARCG